MSSEAIQVPTRPLLTPHEVADLAGVNYATAVRWAREGTVPSVRLTNRYRFRREDVLRLLEHGIPAKSRS